jgi:hypothetical protein
MKKFTLLTFLLFFTFFIFLIVNAGAHGDEENSCDEEYDNAVHENGLNALKCQQNCTDEFSIHIAEKEERAACWAGCDAGSDEIKKQLKAEYEKCIAEKEAIGKESAIESDDSESKESTDGSEENKQTQKKYIDQMRAIFGNVQIYSSGSVDETAPESFPLSRYYEKNPEAFEPFRSFENLFDSPDFNKLIQDASGRTPSSSLDKDSELFDLPDGDFEFRVDISQGSRQSESSVEEIVDVEQGAVTLRNNIQSTYDKADSLVKLPGSQEWIPMEQGMRFPKGTEIFTGFDTTTVLSVPGKGVVEVAPFTNLILDNFGFEEGSGKGLIHNDFYLRTGEIEVDIEGGDYQPAMQVQTPNVIAGVGGTRFWIKYSIDNGYSEVGVYDGEVFVKDEVNKKNYSVKPSGGENGVIIVASQKLSIVKISLFAIVGIVITGAVVWILKKKNKKRK